MHPRRDTVPQPNPCKPFNPPDSPGCRNTTFTVPPLLPTPYQRRATGPKPLVIPASARPPKQHSRLTRPNPQVDRSIALQHMAVARDRTAGGGWESPCVRSATRRRRWDVVRGAGSGCGGRGWDAERGVKVIVCVRGVDTGHGVRARRGSVAGCNEEDQSLRHVGCSNHCQ
jgi:hypothetical protein